MSRTSCARIGTSENLAENDWVTAHAALSRLARERAAADAEEGRWLLRAWRCAAHVHMGFGSFSEYVERLFGYAHRSTQEKLRVAEAMEGLPVLASALDAGSVSWSAVRELTRVAVPDTEGAWLDAARGKTVRQLEELVANKSPGDDPLTPLAPTPRRHVLRFDVAPETFALFRDAMTELRRRAGAALDDDSALLALARQVLGGPEDPGRANYQIALSVCSTCGSARQQGGGELVPVGLHILAMAHCDGQHLGPLEHPANQNASTDANADANADPRGKDETTHEVHSIPGAHVGATHEPQGGQADCHSPAIHNPESGLQRGRARAAAGFPAPDAAINSGEAQDKGVDHCRDDVGHARAGASARVQIPNPEPVHVHPRAKQTIPPALRRAVLLRDHGCCRVPGCKNTLYLDLHHIQLRSEGGRHAPENILSVCGVHHRAIHRGELSIQGTATNPTFQHADGSPYGQIDRPHALDAHAKVFSALRGLGFREAQVRVTLAELQRREALRDASAEQLLRAALQLLTRACASVSR